MKLVLLTADNLPSSIDELRRAPATADVAALLPTLAATRPPERSLLRRLESAPIRPPGIKLAHPHDYADRSRKEVHFAIHDRFFGVFRASGAAPELFAHAVLVGYRDILREVLACGTTLNDEQWGDLRWGLEEAIRFAGGVPGLDPQSLPPPAGGIAPRDPHRRWRVGHHAFFPLIQAVAVGLNCFQTAVLSEDEQTAAEALRFATAAMRASASAMRFASDFPPPDYGGAVRRAMAPPYLEVGLSGVMSEDHVQLIHCFHGLRELLPTLRGQLVELRDRFIDVVETAYEAHKGVCSRFDGDRIVSLRMSNTSTASAVDVLDQLEASRLKILRSP
jgi:hypothetical protein